MKDIISIQRAKLLHPKIRDIVPGLIDLAEQKLSVAIRIVQGYRTFPEQDALYRQRPKVTNAKAGQSYHNYGLAIDFALITADHEISWDTKLDADKDHIADWNEVTGIFVDAGFEWGGSWRTFKDLPHLQKTYGYTWRELLAKHQNKDFIEGTEYINL